MADFESVAVSANGWQLTATITAAVDGGTYAGLNDYTTPGLSLTVQSKSWDATGTQTTVNRTVIATAALRKPYPNQADRDETESGADLLVKYVLSDFIYSTDTITACSIAADFYTDNGTGGSGTTRGGETPSVTNNSTRAYTLPIGMWLNHDRDWVKADSYTVRLTCAHKHFQSGQMVRAVKFIATDVSLNTTSVIVTSMSKVDFTGSGLSASCFEGSLDFTALAQGELVTIDAIIYPWVGDSYQVSVNGATYPSPNLTVLKVLNDRTGAYGTVYAYVDAVGGGTPAVHETAATAATTPFATIAAAASALQTYINANFARNNVSGGIIRLTATTHVHSSYSVRAVGEIPLIVEAADAANKATTIYQDAGAHAFNSIPDYLKIKDVTLRKTGNFVTWDTGTTVNNGAFALILEGCTFDDNGTGVYSRWVDRTGLLYLINCDGDDCGQAWRGSTNIKQVNSWGSGNGSVDTMTFNAVGCKALTAFSAFGSCGSGSNSQTPAGSLLGWCHVGKDSGTNNPVGIDREIGAAGLAIVGNVLEKYGTASGPCISLLAASGAFAGQNCLEIADTVIGERTNNFYNVDGNPVISGISSHSVHQEWNCKNDVEGVNGTYINNWPVSYRVGSSYRVAITGSANHDTVGPGHWLGEIAARGDANGTSASPLDADWANDQSNDGGDAGNGDYTPGASTALPQIPAGETAYPFDLKGRAVPTDGSAYVGAIQQVAAGGIELTADAGSYAITGTAASLEFGREVIAGAGSYAVTGTVATLSQGLTLAADGGSYAISGTAATFVHDRAVIADGGSYSITGTAASLELGREVVAGAGSYALTGSDATLTIDADKRITADAGSYGITGTSASLEHSREVVAGAGSYAVSGTAAALERGLEIAADAGSYNISGTAASLGHVSGISAGSGSYVIAGTVAALDFSGQAAVLPARSVTASLRSATVTTSLRAPTINVEVRP